MRVGNLVNEATINVEGVERGLNKLEGIVNIKNFKCNGILGDDFGDKVGNHINNFKIITKEVDPIHMSIIIDKHNVVTITQNRDSS